MDKGGINLDISKQLSIHTSKGLTCKNIITLNINKKNIKIFCKTDEYDLCVRSFIYVAFNRASYRFFYTLNSINEYNDNNKININEIITN